MVSKLGVLLKSKDNGEQIGVLEFAPDGMLICSIIKKGLHIFAIRSVTDLLEEKDPQPLYKKYEAHKDEKGNLPRDILRSEAEACAKMINEAGLKISGIPVTASVAEWIEADRESNRRP